VLKFKRAFALDTRHIIAIDPTQIESTEDYVEAQARIVLIPTDLEILPCVIGVADSSALSTIVEKNLKQSISLMAWIRTKRRSRVNGHFLLVPYGTYTRRSTNVDEMTNSNDKSGSFAILHLGALVS